MQPAPSGTVALVFTDIQGSTRLWERHGNRFLSVLEMHNAVLRKGIGERGGYEVKTEGDAFVIAFATPGAALWFAVETQWRLHNAPWPRWLLEDPAMADLIGEREGFRGLRVRMGAHVGQPILVWDGERADYLGPAVNRAARVAAAARGGEILVSDALWEAAGSEFAGGTAVDLGLVRLRGLAEPARIWQILPPALGHRSFSSPRGPRPVGLPRPKGPLVGRRSEREALEALWAGGARVVVLHGPVGVGKTHLALASAERAGTGEGLWFCDLAAARDREDLLRLVSNGLGLDTRATDQDERIGLALAGLGRSLGVLDHAEGVAEPLAALLRTWMLRAPEARFLITSRQRLAGAESAVLPVEPLPLEDATRLLRERGALHQPELGSTPDSQRLLAEIAQHLDGLPLALELAAARLGVLSLDALSTRLGSGLSPMDPEGASERGGALRVALDGSWDLLKPWEQGALAQLTVFRGGFSSEAAESVLDLSAWPRAPQPLAVLPSLRDRSLLRLTLSGGEARLSLLGAIAEYAAEKLGPEDRTTAQLRHRRFFASAGAPDALAQLNTRGGCRRLLALALDVENLLVAARTGAEAGDAERAAQALGAARAVLQLQGSLGRLLPLARQIAALPDLSARARARVRTVEGDALVFQGQTAEAVGVLRAAMAESEGDPEAVAVLRGALGHALRVAGQHGEARLHYEQLLREALALGSPQAEARARIALALMAHEGGRSAEAELGYGEALSAARRAGDLRLEGQAMGLLGGLWLERGALDRAEAVLREAIAVDRAVGYRRQETAAIVNLGLVHQHRGELDAALACFEEAVVRHRQDGNRQELGPALSNLGTLHAEAGRPWEARRLLEDAFEMAERAGQPQSEAIARGNLGDVCAGVGETALARQHLGVAVDMLLARQHPAAGAFLGSLGALSAQEGDLLAARAAFDRGEAILRKANHAVELAKLLERRRVAGV